MSLHMTDSACCQSIENELIKVQTRVSNMQKLADSSLDSAIADLEALQHELARRNTDELKCVPSSLQQTIIKETLKRSKDASKNLSNQHKDMHSIISKFGKSIDKNFHTDYSSVSRGLNDESRTSMLNEVICEHFLRQGRLTVAEHLIQESSLTLDDSIKLPFLEMHEIVEGLSKRNLYPALSWVDRNRDALSDLHSNLEFSLLSMHFLQILTSDSPNSRKSALEFCRSHLQQFASTHTTDLQKLMGCFLYHGRSLESSPYAYLVSADAWDAIIEQFSKDACMLLGLPIESPLSITINAGTKALGPLLNITNVMMVKQLNSIWESMNELPVDIELGMGSRFHSIFACPILRQHTSESNPPMRLICGHVISNDALRKLSNVQKLKCPYCPVEQSIHDAVRLYL